LPQQSKQSINISLAEGYGTNMEGTNLFLDR